MFHFGIPLQSTHIVETNIQDSFVATNTSSMVFQHSTLLFLEQYASLSTTLALQRLAELAHASDMLIYGISETSNTQTMYVTTLDGHAKLPLARLREEVQSLGGDHPNNILIDFHNPNIPDDHVVLGWLKSQGYSYSIFIKVQAPQDKYYWIGLFFKELKYYQQAIQLSEMQMVAHLATLLSRYWKYEPLSLTKRQKECLRWAALGKSESDTAKILNIQETTVKFHLNASYDRLGVPNKVAAVAMAITMDMIEI